MLEPISNNFQQPRFFQIHFNFFNMAFAIEVPGEAVPLTPQQVFLALQSAGSSQQVHIQTGAAQLQAWETQRGYYPLLQA
jgi:hypothetical protein